MINDQLLMLDSDQNRRFNQFFILQYIDMALRQKLWVLFYFLYSHFLTQMIMILMIDAVFPGFCMIYYDLKSKR